MDFTNKPSRRLAAIWAGWVAFSLLGLGVIGTLYVPVIVINGIALIPLCKCDGFQIARGLACLWPVHLIALFSGAIIEVFAIYLLSCSAGYLAGESK